MTRGRLSGAQQSILLRPIKPSRVSKDRNGLSHMEGYEVEAHLSRIFGFEGWDKEIRRLWLISEVAAEKMYKENPPKPSKVHRIKSVKIYKLEKKEIPKVPEEKLKPAAKAAETLLQARRRIRVAAVRNMFLVFHRFGPSFPLRNLMRWVSAANYIGPEDFQAFSLYCQTAVPSVVSFAEFRLVVS